MYGTDPVYLQKTKCLPQPVLMGKFEITLDGKNIPYSLKRSSKAKLIWLDIKRQTGLTVTIPQKYSLKYLPDYLQSNAKWILRNFEKYCSAPLAELSAEVHPSNTINYMGRCLTITHRARSTGTNAVTLARDQIILRLNGSLSTTELEHWMRTQAAKVIKNKVAIFAGQMGLIYNRVVIRDQKSRWGSCSCLKNLNFNWRLIMAPEPVLDYVIIHELCHLKEMSHSRSFWNIVAQYCPKWHEYRDWLDSHNSQLKAEFVP
jgi:predicted metal-dependent hydrolase